MSDATRPPVDRPMPQNPRESAARRTLAAIVATAIVAALILASPTRPADPFASARYVTPDGSHIVECFTWWRYADDTSDARIPVDRQCITYPAAP